MKLLTKLCLAQAIVQSEIAADDNGIPVRLFDLYALDKAEKDKIEGVWHNDIFQRLTSSAAVILHQNFLESFCTNKTEFGKKQAEWLTLEIKRKALEFVERMQSADKAALNNAAEKDDQISLAMAVYHYLNGVSGDVFLPLIRRADAHKCAEATVLLLAFEPGRRHELFERLAHNVELLTCGDNSLEVLKHHYKIETTKGVNNDD